MKFQFKIIFVTLAILVVTLLLNSLLSLASFEKLYVDSLVATYQIAGKNLKRKIESSLRFGKPLDRFKGMEGLMQKVRKKSPEIAFVGIGTPDGKILYHTDADRAGMKFKHTVPGFEGRKDAYSTLAEGMYITFLPLYGRSKKLVGVINIAFPREVVYTKLKDMAYENLELLWALMLLTSVGLIFLLGILVVRPIKLKITEISEMLIWPGDPGTPGNKYSNILKNHDGSLPQASQNVIDQSAIIYPEFSPRYFDINKIRTETDRLGWHIYTFVTNTLSTLCKLEDLEKKLKSLLAACKPPDAYESQILQLLKTENISQEQEQWKSLVRENKNLWETLQMIESMKKSVILLGLTELTRRNKDEV